MPFVLSGTDDLIAAAGGHPFARLWLRDGLVDLRCWSSRGALVWTGHSALDGSVDVVGFGPAERVIALLDQLDGHLPRQGGLSVPRDAVPLLPARLRPADGVEWEFRWTTVPPPPQDGEQDVLRLPGTAEPELAALLVRTSQRPEVRPGDPRIRGWVGVRDPGGRLVAMAADTSGAGIGYMSAVATDESVRRQGWGSAVTARLSRWLIEEFGVASLGLYSDNAAARRLYVRLGFGDVVEMTSGTLP